MKNAIVAFFNLAKLGRAPRVAWSAPRGSQNSDLSPLFWHGIHAMTQPVDFFNGLLETRYRPDPIVFDSIIVELKAATSLNTDHEAQLFNYMRIARQSVGYLLNFGKKGDLEWKRFILSDLSQRPKQER